jgi:hypothetical protein
MKKYGIWCISLVENKVVGLRSTSGVLSGCWIFFPPRDLADRMIGYYVWSTDTCSMQSANARRLKPNHKSNPIIPPDPTPYTTQTRNFKLSHPHNYTYQLPTRLNKLSSPRRPLEPTLKIPPVSTLPQTSSHPSRPIPDPTKSQTSNQKLLLTTLTAPPRF